MADKKTSGPNFRVIAVGPKVIQVEVIDVEQFRKSAGSLSLGSYLKVGDDNNCCVLALVEGYKIKQAPAPGENEEPQEPSFVVDAQPIGHIVDGTFRRGGQQVTIPPSKVEIASSKDLKAIYEIPEAKRFVFGTLSQFDDVDVAVDGNRLFSTHIAVVGSTGSGKSCTVAKILQEGVKRSNDQEKAKILNNAHIILFDLHGEYKAAFPSANHLNIDNLKLPYWLLTSEELEEMFVEISNEQNHNQRSQFRHAVIENKKKHNGADKVSYDSPVYFSLSEVRNYLANLTTEMIWKGDGDGKDKPKLKDNTVVERREDHYFAKVHEFVAPSTAAATKAVNGPLSGELDRFLMRLDSKLNDDRLAFILKPQKDDGKEFQTVDLESLIRQFVGYISKSEANVTVIDLSGIPFEVLSIVVSLISRLVFDVCFRYKKLLFAAEKGNGKKPDASKEWPVLMVYEEAHKYVPKDAGAAFASVSKSIERIAKEGRKYGISLMIVSQRPSEISENIFSQCNNVIAMRLTNPSDQNYVQRMLPDAVGNITDCLPILEKREALILGDSIALPTIVKVGEVKPVPDSHDIDVHGEWKKDWLDLKFDKVLASSD